MTIHIENDYGKDLIPDQTSIIERVILGSLDYLDCPYECQVDILLTDGESIRRLNREYRGIDRVTDVLSFPAADYPDPGKFDRIEADDPMAFHPESGELLLGDIVLCMDRVKDQARQYGHSLTRELAFLLAHSMLHLTGYDHMTEDEREIMERKQEEILQRLGIRREGSAGYEI